MSKKPNIEELEQRDRVAVALHAIEGIAFSEDENELFAMFDREGWSGDQIRAYLHSMLKSDDTSIAAE